MLLTDYLKSTPDITWDYAKQCGVNHATIRLPETKDFDITDLSHWKTVYDRFQSAGLTPVVVEPLPNELHDHIKAGDALRDESIAKAIEMLKNMDQMNIRMVCFNFMAYLGWTRTSSTVLERGNALVTGFKLEDFKTDCTAEISAEQMWANYWYFIDAILPYAEKYGIKLALHPDDPPLEKLAGVSRIFTSFDAIHHAVTDRKSDYLGVTMCQASYKMMGEDLYKVIPAFAKENKIFFVHFRDVDGIKTNFHETFHDNGPTDMAAMLRLYMDCGVNVPIRVDHVPCMAGESVGTPGYDRLGRLFAIGYLKGLTDAIESERK